jgi:hypothetical protein
MFVGIIETLPMVLACLVKVRLTRLFEDLLIYALVRFSYFWTHDCGRSRFFHIPLAAIRSSPFITAHSVLLVDVLDQVKIINQMRNRLIIVYLSASIAFVARAISFLKRIATSFTVHDSVVPRIVKGDK